ncbi:hypothetical protein [Candidatus Puniceispirillum marinum]|uniref:Glutathione reductase n=1 Tax=Puniceispirillum marinum (strain IMCC1322) TaxID=488538 RepID=D5BRK8_PUNMI|nr:hypothetical protein [Candidatus Puniceispirillum marinum]ADE38905.1 Glutathione reductase [Candidatus Puniceispirillum marinum IMCC1322]
MRIVSKIGKIASALCGGIAMWLMVSTAQAQVTVYLEDDIKVTFSSGSFDNRNLNGEMQDVTIFIDDQRVLTADEVEVETSGEAGTANHMIKRLRMKNIFFDDLPLSVKSLNIRDMAPAFFSSISEHAAHMNAITDSSHVSLTGVAYAAHGMSLTIDRITSLPFKFGALANGDPFITKLGMQVENLILTPLQNRGEFAHFIAATGEPNLTLNMTQTQVNAINNGVVSSDIVLKTAMNGIGNLDAQLGIEMSLDSYNKLFMSDTYDLEPDEIEDVALDDMSIVFDDHGAVNAALHMSARKQNVDYMVARDQTITAMKATLGSFLPMSSNDLMPPLETFVKDGGQIRLSAVPAKPFPFINITQYIFAADAAVKKLNLKLLQTPHAEGANAAKLQKTKTPN